MIRRLVEADFFGRRETATAADIRFWLRELRTPELLVAVAASHRESCRRLVARRPCLELALRGDESELVPALAVEESREREADRRYWEPLRTELETLRHKRGKLVSGYADVSSELHRSHLASDAALRAHDASRRYGFSSAITLKESRSIASASWKRTRK